MCFRMIASLQKWKSGSNLNKNVVTYAWLYSPCEQVAIHKQDYYTIFLFLCFFIFLSDENMIAHLQETWKK